MNLRIIELDIEEALSADTRVEEVALVEMPAIETEFVYFSKQKFYKAPDYVANVACQAIKENEKRGNPAATQVGKVRAQQLCNQSEISLETIKRMKSYLERAKVYNTDDWDDNGTISWKLWGGAPALKWVDTILERIEKQELDYDIQSLPVYEQYPTGDTKNDMLVEPIAFIEKIPYERKDEYISRCIEYHVKVKGMPVDQATAVCYSQAEQAFDCGCNENMAIEPNPCWDGYEPYGTKMLNGKEVPNCIPIKNSKQEFELLGYIDGIPYFSTPEEAETYGKENYGCQGHHTHTDENGNEVYMSCETHDEIDQGMELEELLSQGWKIVQVNQVDESRIQEIMRDKYSKVSKQQFYKIVTSPNEPSILDFAGVKIRYVYAVGPGAGNELIPTSRMFCKRMLGGRQFVFRYEDIIRLNAEITAEDADRTIIPRPKGTTPDIQLWKGGANCRHIWLELIFQNPEMGVGYEDEITNNKLKEQRKAVMVSPASGQAGIQNPKANPARGSRDGIE